MSAREHPTCHRYSHDTTTSWGNPNPQSTAFCNEKLLERGSNGERWLASNKGMSIKTLVISTVVDLFIAEPDIYDGDDGLDD